MFWCFGVFVFVRLCVCVRVTVCVCVLVILLFFLTPWVPGLQTFRENHVSGKQTVWTFV